MNGMIQRRWWAGLLLALGMVAVLGTAEAAEGGQRKKFVLDTTAEGANIKETVTQLPLLLRLHSGNFSFATAKPDGSDLHFLAADGKTPLPHRVENFDAANELANVWVGLPSLAGNSKAGGFLMSWGGDKPAPGDGGKGLHDASQILVFHFSDAEGVKDATPNGLNARLSTAKPVPTGSIGGAAAFDGTSRVEVGAADPLKITAAGGMSFTVWLRPSGADDATLIQLGGPKGFRVALAAGKPSVALGTAAVTAPGALTPGEWQHLAVVVGAGKVSVQVNGSEVAGGALALTDLGGDLLIGEGFRGEMDELGLAGTARSPDYIKALVQSQSPDALLASVAEDEAAGEEISYFAILIGSVTLDGWIVIGLLTVMAVVSVYVMVTKALMLSAAKKANRIFLEIFQSNPTDLLTPGHENIAALANDARFKHSSVYRLYQTGIAETQLRADAQTRAGRPFRLTANGLSAIRSSLDATMLREGQRLNSGIVLLTIAISGGPFLGLLGTVVGVMITFAAIAAAGDVNVNAIAPGIAAALVATVAGLAVAIPALFGYNWLASQIKNVSSDLAVYLDEFVTKTAELHAD